MKDCQTLQWNSAYTIGHPSIDKEHQNLFILAQKVEHCNTPLEIRQAVKELVEYTKYHFRNEEKYMRTLKYPELETHTQIHKKITKTLDNFITKMDTLSQNEMFTVLNSFVDEYLIKHILIEDKKVHHFRRDENELRKIFQWQDSYKIEQETIDQEHHKLFEIALKTLDHQNNENPKEFIKSCVKELYNYMKIHFENEEKIMETIGYPLYSSHKKLHDNIIEQMNGFIRQIPTMKFTEFERKLIEYMDIWLISHIIYDDKKIQCFIESQKEGK